MSVAHIPLGNTTTTESAYAAYVAATGALARVAILNMNGHNTTDGGTGLGLAAPNATAARASRTYTLDVSAAALADGARVAVRRLCANGSDAISGISWDGWSYNYELDAGRPVRLANVTAGEAVRVSGGLVVVSVPDSSAAMLDFPVVAAESGAATGPGGRGGRGGWW